MSQLADRYARAAWAVAQGADAGAALIEDFAVFAGSYAAEPSLRQALENPAFKNERAGVLTGLLAKAETRPVAARLLQLMLEHERLPLLADVEASLRALADAASGRVRASVQAAVPLSAEQVVRIEEVLTKRVGRPVVAEVQVDPTLVAGMVCRVGRLTFDSSLKKQLGHFAEFAGVNSAPPTPSF